MQIGLGGAVFIVFLVLKLIGKIDWSWWWVTSPIWGAFALTILFLMIGAGAVVGTHHRNTRRMHRRMQSRKAGLR